MPSEPPKNARNLKGKRGLVRLFNATRYSFLGFRAAWLNEAAFREESLLAVILVPAALLLPVTTLEKVVLIEATLLVPLVEMLNSALEAVVDRIGPELHPLSGRAKDMGSAAVFISLVIALAAWLMIAGPVLWSVLGA